MLIAIGAGDIGAGDIRVGSDTLTETCFSSASWAKVTLTRLARLACSALELEDMFRAISFECSMLNLFGTAILK